MNNPTTLRVKFPISQWPGWHSSEFSLNALLPVASDDSAERITVNVDPESHADYSSDSPVFRASIEGTEAVFALKFAMREDLIYDLEEEGRVYRDALQTLQGQTTHLRIESQFISRSDFGD